MNIRTIHRPCRQPLSLWGRENQWLIISLLIILWEKLLAALCLTNQFQLTALWLSWGRGGKVLKWTWLNLVAVVLMFLSRHWITTKCQPIMQASMLKWVACFLPKKFLVPLNGMLPPALLYSIVSDKKKSHRGVAGKPLALYPGVPSSVDVTLLRGYKTWVQSQTQNKAQWLAACEHVSASSQSLCFILSLRMNLSPYNLSCWWDLNQAHLLAQIKEAQFNLLKIVTMYSIFQW